MHSLGVLLYNCRNEWIGNWGGAATWIAPAVPTLGILFCVGIGAIFYRKHGYVKSLWPVILEARSPRRGIPGYHTFMHILTCGVSVGMGISAGMEAPSALTGSAIGCNMGRRFGLPKQLVKVLLAAGAAAGISAVFRAPMAGTLFACEVLLPGVSGVMLVPLLLAAAAGALVTHFFNITGTFPEITYSWQMRLIWQYALIGILCGVCSWSVIRLNCTMAKYSKRVKSPWVKALVGGALLYIAFLVLPALGGQGYNFIGELLNNLPKNLPTGILATEFGSEQLRIFAMLLLLTLLKPLVSVISLNAGGDGGMFGPSLCTGAFLGYVFYMIAGYYHPDGVPALNCVAAGMAGVLAGVMHAPLTGLFLIAELLGGYTLFVPLMVVVSISTFISRILAKRNLYAATAAATAARPEEVAGLAADGVDDLSETQVGDLTDCNYYTLLASDTFKSLLELMMRTRQLRFPVVNQQGKLVGMIDERQIRPYVLNAKFYTTLIVDDFMVPPKYTIDAEETVGNAIDIFDRTHLDALPVTRQGRFIGMLSRTHLLEGFRRYLNTQEWLEK